MLTFNQLDSVQEHLQLALEDSIRAEIKFMLEEGIITGLPDSILIDHYLARLKVTVGDVS